MNWWVLKRRIHASWLIAIVAASCVCGVAMAQYMPQLWFTHSVWLASAIVLTIIGFWERYIVIIPLCVIAGIIFGFWRGSIDRVDLSMYDQLFGHQVELSGTVLEDIDQQANGQFVMKIGNVRQGTTSLPGMVWLTASDGSPVQRSDTVTISGKLAQGFGSFSASMYRVSITRVERASPGDVALGIRDWFANAVRTVISEPQASLGLGFLLGQRRALPPELSEALQIAGLTHVIVASGYNLTILVRFARRLFVKLSRYTALLASSGMVLSFIAITGMSPSMSRAGLVTGLSLLAWYYGRKFHPIVLLTVAAAVTVIINPSYAWGDIGWQLSFAAFSGVMILAPLLQRYFFGESKPGTIRQILGETIAAQIATLPIIIVAFGAFSNVALIGNMMILPLVPLAMLLVFMSGIIALSIPAISIIIAAPTTWLLGYMTTVAQQLASIPWAMTGLTVGGWFMALSYLLLVGICFFLWRRTGLDLRNSNIIE